MFIFRPTRWRKPLPKIGFASLAMLDAPWTETVKTDAELNCVYKDIDPDKISDETVAEVIEITNKSGIECCIHAPFFELNIAAPGK